MNLAFSIFDKTRRALTPLVTQSAFLEKGVLTPEEFVKAGDNLVHNCPSWQWSGGDPAYRASFLPENKQYLITKGAPCFHRVQTMAAMHSVDEMTGDNEGWCAPTIRSPGSTEDDGVIISSGDLDQPESASTSPITNEAKDISSSLPAAPANTADSSVKTPAADDDDCLDMEDSSLALEEDDSTPTAKPSASSNASSALPQSQQRRYDISITYDPYYGTPRIWLFGYNEKGTTLTIEQIYQDVMQDYAKKTVDQQAHPHTGKDHASIHPCQHATAMLSFISALRASGKVPIVENYMFVFLKFIQSVVPTIEYDFTVDVEIFGSTGSSGKGSSSSSSSSGGVGGAGGAGGGGAGK